MRQKDKEMTSLDDNLNDARAAASLVYNFVYFLSCLKAGRFVFLGVSSFTKNSVYGNLYVHGWTPPRISYL
jgi:hypothetical protein